MKHRFIGIDHVQLAAPQGCEESAAAFYRDVLGMEQIEKPEALRRRGGVWFLCGKHQVHIGVQEPFVPAAKAHPAFEVTNLQALKEHLLERGCSVQEDAPLEGVSRFHVQDPFGNRIEFVELHYAVN